MLQKNLLDKRLTYFLCVLSLIFIFNTRGNAQDTDSSQTLAWKQIQSALDKGTAFIEIKRTLQSNRINYLAQIIKADTSEKPIEVLLTEGGSLDEKYPRYYHFFIENKQEDTLSYQTFWQPIAQNLKDIKRIYIVPKGGYTKINLNTLFNPNTKKYLIDEFDVHYLFNAEDLLQLNAAAVTKKPQASKQSMDTTIFDFSQEKNQKISLSDVSGTQKEVENIVKLLKEQNQQVKLYKENEALEKNLKDMQKPKLLHISSPGFYWDAKNSSRLANASLPNQLSKAGIVLNKGDDAQNPQDGIITSYEAVNLGLEGTDLVVLSADQSAIGGDDLADLSSLSMLNAFHTSGAKTIIASLWRIDREATAKLMAHFYQEQFSGKTKAEAFRLAQLEVRKEYPHPFYWGAFILKGE